MNLLELGGLLKSEREKHGLSVRDVMEATKISRRNLNALEGGEIKLLPHPVYLKGYVRNYARLVGLDAEPLVAVVEQQSDGDSGYVPQAAPVAQPEIVASHETLSEPEAAPAAESAPAQSEAAAADNGLGLSAVDTAPASSEPAASEPAGAEPAPAEAEPASAEPAPQSVSEPASQEQPGAFVSQIRYPKTSDLTPKPRRRVWPWVLLLLFAGVMGALYVQYQRIQAEVDQTPPAAAPAPVDNATNATNATDDVNATLPEANASLSESAPETAPAQPAPGQQSVSPASGQAAPAAKPLPPQTATPAVSASPVEVSRKGQPAAPAATPAAQPASAPNTEVRTPGMQQLVITAKPNEACWVEVSEGSQRKSFIVKNGDSRRFEFSSKAKVRLGNAGGVSFKLNGAAYPFEGERGATATVEIGAR
ncbi:helix-turn-helix domain-containing protein [Humidesulfovibrio idahonensis]